MTAPPLGRRLLVDGRAVAPLHIARSPGERGRGLLGRRSFDGALLLPRTRSVHSIGMRFALEVALLDEDLQVQVVESLPPGRLLLPRRGARHILEAEAGRFAAWQLRPGSRIGWSLPDPSGANRRRIAPDEPAGGPGQAGDGPDSPAGST